MNELKYAIYQKLLDSKTDTSSRELKKDVERHLENERVSFDKDLLQAHIDECLREINQGRAL